MEQMLEQAEAVLRFSGDLQKRMVEVGVEGVGGAIGLYTQLKNALEKVSHEELEWAAGEVERVMEGLKKIGEEIEKLKSLKATFSRTH